MKFYMLIALMLVSTSTGWGFKIFGKKKNVDLTPSANKQILKAEPKWYSDVKEKKGWKYQKATATSRDAQTATDKARLSAITTMRGLIGSEAQQVVDRVITESGLGENSEYTDNFKNTMRQIVGDLVEDLDEIESEVKVVKGEGIYRAYYLIGHDTAAANNKIIEQLQADKKLYEEIKASEYLQEMEEKVEQFRQRYAK